MNATQLQHPEPESRVLSISMCLEWHIAIFGQPKYGLH
jgi:hypothetical protein